jgi:outer membrane protein OmpA-like peptidoglycan-associated protein
MLKLRKLAPIALLALALPVFAQDQQESDRSLQIANQNETPPLYRVNVVERTAKAIDYLHKGKKVEVNLVGTSLQPDARGRAKVEPHTGRMKIDVDFNHMKPAQTYGPEYLTYVLWAITPQGRPVNLGEVVLKNKKDTDSNLHVTSNLQTFGMIVTAEPYFSVTRPSDVVVMENEITPNLKADVQPISTKYEALARNEYRVDISPNDLPSATATDKTPLDLLEAQNAVVIAKAAGADRYAASSMQSAQDQLNAAENAFRQGKSATDIGTPARQAAQTAEDARLVAIRKKRDEQIAQERAAAQRRTEQAHARAEAEAQRAEQARLQAERETQQRQQADEARRQAEAAAQQASLERQQADQARQQALAQQQQLAQQAQQAQLQAQQADQARIAAEQQAQQTRERLLSQLNSILQTRESARGLIVNMNDVLFDTGKATLKPGARVRLAKVAGIVMAYPDLKLQVEGFTDNVGSEEYNQQLSERRAQAVRDFLVAQGVPDANIASRGFGKADPIASNDTASGRQMNRRVDLVVSGNAIGTNIQPSSATPSQTPTQEGAIASPSNNNPR